MPGSPGQSQCIATSGWFVASSSLPWLLPPRKKISLLLHEVAHYVLFFKRQGQLTHGYTLSTPYTISILLTWPQIWVKNKIQSFIRTVNVLTEWTLSCREHNLLEVKWFINLCIYFTLGPNSFRHLPKYAWKPSFQQKTSQVKLFLKPSKKQQGMTYLTFYHMVKMKNWNNFSLLSVWGPKWVTLFIATNGYYFWPYFFSSTNHLSIREFKLSAIQIFLLFLLNVAFELWTSFPGHWEK